MLIDKSIYMTRTTIFCALVATAVLASLQEHRVLEEVINRTVAAVEAEWSGKFLPELRRTIKADVMEALRTGSL